VNGHQPYAGNGPLSGLRVVELADPRTGFAGKLLADMGADVLLVEPPGGSALRRVGPFADDRPDPNRSLPFWYDNTSKRGVTASIDQAEGRDLLRRLITHADIVIEAQPPGRLAALDLDYAACAAERPGLIWCSITPFGHSGPYRDFTMTDLTSIAFSGIMASCGYDDVPGSPPIRPDGGHSLHMAGVYGAIAVLVALLERDASGAGQWIDLSMHEACAGTVEGAFPNWEYFHRPVIRQTGRHSGPNPTPPWQVRSADGIDLNMIGSGLPRNPRTWQPLVRWMAEHDLAGDLEDPLYNTVMTENPYSRGDHFAHIAAMIARFVGAISSEEAYRVGQSLHLPYGPVRSPDENLDDPHWRERGFFVEVEHPELGRTYTYPGLPYLFEGTPGRVRSRAPLLGEHTYDVYVRELGLTPEALRECFEQGAI
jgi:crotonobetainyl-CoA:carnitine CoA-transferase CaiB-like acyl-CoA transferase